VLVMRNALICVGVAVAVLLAVFTGAAVGWMTDDHRSAVVYIQVGEGHGSGVHIGQGYVLTAAHVVVNQPSVVVRAESGGVAPARVLWANEAKDVALLKVDLDMGAASLECRVPQVGEDIEAVGNPLSLEFVHTYGKVAGGVRKAGDIEETFVASLAVAPGMSGGPVFDARGRLIGLVSALMMWRDVMTAAPLAVSFIVPGKTICGLLGR
jgi:serine protease Do